MTDERKDLPPVTSPNFLEKVREALSVYLGNRGSGLDRGVTLRDLSEAGLVELRKGFGSGNTRNPIGGAGSLITSGAGGDVGGGDVGGGAVYEPDLTPPPTPTGFTSAAGITNLLLECDPQTYTQGHGHAKSKLYGATWTSGPLPVFTDAVVITEFGGTVASHATNPATTWHLWLTWVTVDGVESTTAAGSTNGEVTTTGQDVSLLLAALAGEITASELNSGLGARINLVDAPTTGLVDQLGVVKTTVNHPTTGVAATSASLDTVKLTVNNVTTGVAATATRVSSLETTVNTGPDRNTALRSTITSEATTRANADTALATRATNLETSVNNGTTGLATKASVAYVDTAKADAISASATSIQQLQSQLDFKPRLYFGFNAGIEEWFASGATLTHSNGALVWTTTQSNAELVRNLSVPERFQGSEATAIRVRARRVSGFGSWNGRVLYSTTSHGRGYPYDITILGPNNPMASRNPGEWAIYEWDMSNLPLAGPDWIDSVILDFSISLTDEVGDVWEIDWVSVGSPERTPLTTALQVEATTRASQTGGLYAQYTVKLDVNGKVSGYGLASTGPTGTGSTFEVRADKFVIAAPTGSAAGYVPFSVLAVPTLIGGITLPAGVYAQNAFIQDAQITNAKIANLAVDDAKISALSATKITAGSIGVGSYISSTSYTAGSAGWRINADGTAEFSGVVVRGTVFATAGQIGGITIASNAIQSGQTGFDLGQGFFLGANGTFSVGISSGNRLTWDGLNLTVVGPNFSLINGNANFSGDISGSSGVFSGSITGATGEFAGTLRAGVLDVSSLVGTSVAFSSSGSTTVPANARSMKLTLVGGGGGGGCGSHVDTNGTGGGGGGSGYTWVSGAVWNNLTPGTVISVTIGAGGAGGLNNSGWGYYGDDGANGSAGSATSVAISGSVVASAAGGGGGVRGPGRNANTGAGGIGGVNGTSGVGRGGNGGGLTLYGPGGAGGYPPASTLGLAATSFGGGGGGGGGHYSGYDTPTHGGNGRSGYAVVQFFDPNGVVLRNTFEVLTSALSRQNIAVT